MGTPVEQFAYDLPEHFIAQAPVEPRDHAKLLVMDRTSGKTTHKHFYDLVDELRASDVLVFNASKVFRARLLVPGFEMLVLKVRDGEVDALVKPGRKYPVGATVPVGDFVVTGKTADGVVTLRTGLSAAEMFAFCETHGEVPTPPYVTKPLVDDASYQTVYAKATGSVAAPTAGLHFTEELLEAIRAKGVEVQEVTLHVGIGTFRPVQTATIEEHVMHSEWVSIDEETVAAILRAKADGRRVIAVGTTTVRVLEGIAVTRGSLVPYTGELNLFITPRLFI